MGTTLLSVGAADALLMLLSVGAALELGIALEVALGFGAALALSVGDTLGPPWADGVTLTAIDATEAERLRVGAPLALELAATGCELESAALLDAAAVAEPVALSPFGVESPPPLPHASEKSASVLGTGAQRRKREEDMEVCFKRGGPSCHSPPGLPKLGNN